MLDWYNNIENKNQKCFLQLYIVEYYPSISEELLDKALHFAKSKTRVTNQTITIIKHARKSSAVQQTIPQPQRTTNTLAKEE